jgi:LysR family transcriptional regulator, hydrogen peroxide-inducible genes activator
MEFHQLRYFLAVARLRSFTRAAQHEHVAQPSLSQQIRKLEDELGARLFNRPGRSITLTPFGQRFEQHARRVLDEIEGARHEMDEMLGLRRGSVNLGAIPTIAPQPTRTVGLVRAKEKFVTPATRAFVDHVRKACGAPGDRAMAAAAAAQASRVPMARSRDAKFLP